MAEKKARGRKLKYGSVSALMLVLILAALIILNIGAQMLEKKKGWKIDFSFNAITSQSPETVGILKSIKYPVKIWALYRKGDEDAPLMELLDRYAAASDLITWEQVDPAMNPALLKRFTTDTEAPGSDSLIIWCEKTGRFRVLGPEDYVSIGMDEITGEYTYTGWTYERSLTNAIAFVTKDVIPKAVILQGHEELNTNDLAAFETLLADNQYDVVYRDLSDAQYTPDPADLLIFFSPQRDLTEAELEKLTEFAGKGGSFLFGCDYADPIEKMPNYAALLRSYGFLPMNGIVIADPADGNSYYNGNQVWLLPEMYTTDITMDLILSGTNHLLLPGARAFEEPGEGDRNLTVTTVLRSGPTSWVKRLDTGAETIDRTAEDPIGSFPLALEARRITGEGYISRAFIIGCSAAMADQQLYSMTDSRAMVIRTAEFLLKLDASDLNIMPREAVRPALKTTSTGLGSLILTALPLSIICAALLVLGPRRNR